MGIPHHQHFIVALQCVQEMVDAYWVSSLNVLIEVIVDAVMKIVVAEILEVVAGVSCRE